MKVPLYNSKIIDTYVKFIKNRYSSINVSELLSSAGMHMYEVADPGHWFTQDQVDRFYFNLVALSGNENIARETGRYAASPDALGVMRQFVLGFIGPAHTFEIINKIMSSFTRSSSCQSKLIASNSVEIIVTPYEGVEEKPFQCENRLGLFEAIVLRFGLGLPQVEHSECIFKGGTSCRYILTWKKPVSSFLQRVGIGITLFFAFVTLILLLTSRWSLLGQLFPLFIAIVCLFAYAGAEKEKKELQASLDEFKDSTDSLLEQINSNYNIALMTNEIGQVLGAYTDREDILSHVNQVMENRLDYDRGLIFIANPEKSRLVLHAGYGYSPEQRIMFDSISFHLDRPESKGIFTISFREQRPFLVNDLDDIVENLSPRSLAFAKKTGTKSFICCPIVCEGKSIGVLAVDNVKTKRPLVESDIRLLMGIASVIGISLRNAELIESKIRQFNSVIEGLAASIDARDELTSKHSKNVTKYAVGICNELSLSRDDCDVVQVAAQLHDYGKIGVPDAILTKPGKLTPEEYDIVKTHAAKSREILERINFEGIYHKVPEIAGAHHEKVDGTGYPRGLKGRAIPRGARIIAVADYFEAITSKRHYRESMSIDEAIKLMREESGKQFDKWIVEAFLRFHAKTSPQLPEGTDVSACVIDRRRNARVRKCVPVAFLLNGKSSVASSVDISMGGIFIASDEEVLQGLPVELSITVANDSPTVEAVGRISWVNSWSSIKKATLPPGFGVELLEYKDANEGYWQTFLSRYVLEENFQGG